MGGACWRSRGELLFGVAGRIVSHHAGLVSRKLGSAPRCAEVAQTKVARCSFREGFLDAEDGEACPIPTMRAPKLKTSAVKIPQRSGEDLLPNPAAMTIFGPATSAYRNEIPESLRKSRRKSPGGSELSLASFRFSSSSRIPSPPQVAKMDAARI
jgi:hypothetical protein